jgi:hypothetical protein
MFEWYAASKLFTDPHWLDVLRGHDLACWCPLDKPCHADVLLRLANTGSSGLVPAPQKSKESRSSGTSR